MALAKPPLGVPLARASLASVFADRTGKKTLQWHAEATGLAEDGVGLGTSIACLGKDGVLVGNSIVRLPKNGIFLGTSTTDLGKSIASLGKAIVDLGKDGVVFGEWAQRGQIGGRADVAEWGGCVVARVPSVACVTRARARRVLSRANRTCFVVQCSRRDDQKRTPPMLAMARANGGWATSVV